jgi:hypothetical protein
MIKIEKNIKKRDVDNNKIIDIDSIINDSVDSIINDIIDKVSHLNDKYDATITISGEIGAGDKFEINMNINSDNDDALNEISEIIN